MKRTLAAFSIALFVALASAAVAEDAGGPVPDPKAEEATLSLLKRLAQAPAAGAATEWTMVMCCPALAQRLVAKEPGLAAKSATAMQQVVDRKTMKGENKRALMFTRQMPQFSPDSLLRSKAFQDLCAAFARGKARAATAEERDLFYGEIPFEIAGIPVTVVNARGETLLVHQDRSSTGSLYMDVLSDLAASFGRPLPLPPADLSSPEGALEAFEVAVIRSDAAALAKAAASEVVHQFEKDREKLAAAWRDAAEGTWKKEAKSASVQVTCAAEAFAVSLQKKDDVWTVVRCQKEAKKK